MEPEGLPLSCPPRAKCRHLVCFAAEVTPLDVPLGHGSVGQGYILHHMPKLKKNGLQPAISEEELARAEAEYGIRFRSLTPRQLKAAVRRAERNNAIMDKSIERAKRVSDNALRIRFDR